MVPMLTNCEKCRHCGRIFVRTDHTAVVNRSDGRTFHVSLFSGPIPRPLTQEGLHANQAICNFRYVHDLIKPTWNSIVVFIAQANEGRQELLQQIEKATDKIARLLKAAQEMESVYT